MSNSPQIQPLPDDVIDKIAAGEVIERPASVVKELVENAFDARATLVEVDVEGGGLDSITVTDDGIGMGPNDAVTAFRRHATSKLTCAEDLFRIQTLGFRGEALSSIAAVSRVQLTTRPASAQAGTRVEIEGGVVRQVSDVGCPVGTSIWVRDVFYNTPARRKFMRSPATEQGHVVDAVLRVVLGARAGGAVVRAGERRLLDLCEGDSLLTRAQTALGRKVKDVYPFAVDDAGIRVSGFVAPPEQARRDTRGLWFFVNGRFVRDRMLQRSLMDVCGPLLSPGRYPVAVLYIDLDPEAVDVNVHPQKLEVRFGNGRDVYRSLGAALTAVFGEAPWEQGAAQADQERPQTRDLWPGSGPTAPSTRSVATPGSSPRPVDLAYRPMASHTPTAARENSGSLPGAYEVAPSTALPQPAFNFALWPFGAAAGELTALAPLGEVAGSLFAFRNRKGLVIVDVDQVAYQVAMRQMLHELHQAAELTRENLLLPDIVDTAGKLGEMLEASTAQLARLGISIEPVGPQRHAVRAVPAPLCGIAGRRILPVVSEALTAGDTDRAFAVRLARLVRAKLPGSASAGGSVASELWRLFVQFDTAPVPPDMPVHRKPYRCFSQRELGELLACTKGA